MSKALIVGPSNASVIGTTSHSVPEIRADRYGLVTGRVTISLKEAIIPTRFPEVEDAPFLLGLPCVNIVRAYEGGWAKYTYDYEGVRADYDRAVRVKKTFELDVSLSEENIQTHPQFEFLKNKYGWDPNKKEFKDKPPDDKGNKLGDNATNKRTKRSKLVGVTDYLAAGAIYRVNYVLSKVPKSVLEGIGAIYGAEPPYTGEFGISLKIGKRTWLKMAPKVRNRGNCSEISEEYLLSGQDGWVEDVYSRSQLDPDSKEGGPGIGDSPGAGPGSR